MSPSQKDTAPWSWLLRVAAEIQRAVLLQKESPSDVQLHLAALQGDVDLLRRVLDSGKVHVDSRDKVRSVSTKTWCPHDHKTSNGGF
jgi:hypothetical protein